MFARLQLPCMIGIKHIDIDYTIDNANEVIRYLYDIDISLAYKIICNSVSLIDVYVVSTLIHYNDINTLIYCVRINPVAACLISSQCLKMNKLSILYRLHLARLNWCLHMRTEFMTTYCPEVFLGLVALLPPDMRRITYGDVIAQDNLPYLKLLIDNYGWSAGIPYNVIKHNALCCLDYIKGYLTLPDIKYMIDQGRWNQLYSILRGYICLSILLLVYVCVI